MAELSSTRRSPANAAALSLCVESDPWPNKDARPSRLFRGIKGRTERYRGVHDQARHGEDEPTQTDVAMELFEVLACDEQELLTLGVVESSRRGLSESR
jgi:hypothetical protein